MALFFFMILFANLKSVEDIFLLFQGKIPEEDTDVDEEQGELCLNLCL